MQRRLKDYPECHEDILKHCTKGDLKLDSDLAIIECLQEIDYTERDRLDEKCENLLWQFKVLLGIIKWELLLKFLFIFFFFARLFYFNLFWKNIA